MIRRIRAAGLEVWFVPEAAVRHQMPSSRTTFAYARRHAFDSARSRVIDRAALPGAHASPGLENSSESRESARVRGRGAPLCPDSADRRRQEVAGPGVALLRLPLPNRPLAPR